MATQPNVLFLFSDEHSFRFLGAMNQVDPSLSESAYTPNLDRLASNGTLFSNAYCQMPLCTPSRLCLLTGQEVRNAGAWSNTDVLRPGMETVATAFGKGGYRTALVGKMHLGGRRQMAGFDDRPYGDLTGRCGHQVEPIDNETYAHTMRARTEFTGKTGLPETQLQDQITSNESLAWIREQEAKEDSAPWFLMAGFSRPHFPITAPTRWLDYYAKKGVSPPKVPASGDAYDHPMSVGMRNGFKADEISQDECMAARHAYFAAVSYLDEIIGDLLLRLESDGSLLNTIVVYTTDHGEMAGEHGVWWKNGWYEACTRVPLIISRPEDREHGSGNICSTPVGLIDLFPTLCTLTGVNPPQDLDGRDVSAATEGVPLADQPVFCDALTPRWGEGTEFRSVRYKNLKYVRFRDAAPLCFDLESDPGEQVNLLGKGTEGKYTDDIAVIRKIAEESIDFDGAEKERLDRDGDLQNEYPLLLEHGDPSDYLNCYTMPDGRLIAADRFLYSPEVLLENAGESLE